MPQCETPTGVSIHYEVSGTGRPLVLVHGWAASGAFWRFQEPLAESCRLVTVDLRGHGRSSSPASGYGLADLTDDIAALFDELDLTDAVLLGWSLGAQVALAAFPHLRQRLAGLVLIGGTPRFTLADGYDYGLPPAEPRGMGAGIRRDFQKTMGGFFRRMFAAGELSREQENRLAREIVIPGRLPEPRVALATLDILSTADLRDTLQAIDLPVLLIHGGADTICLPAASRYMANHLPHARLVEMAGAGHAPFLSRPEECNRLLAAFLETLHGRD
ncbi:alpha/beta fold hydrolase [Geomobilimonas luticola]|uniref:Alpha/beta fold hydrolase n=1 Tax=Geomobilimonas luticola TaxID=1114878 RepID=A0ABS5SH01_9BACT|nr:alpha/beta fold hydrolase [Geomobilimonas luticola]MBT0654638.1 alpha/beta fold hydrolase [Geomobilimonas luticola]